MQIAFTVGMVGITYAAVPLYRMFCQVRAGFDVHCIATMLRRVSCTSGCERCLSCCRPQGMAEQWLRARCVGAACRTAPPCCGAVCQCTGFPFLLLRTLTRARRLSVQTVEDKIRARQENPDAATEEAAAARELTVTFNADVNDGMPWRFLPSQRAVKVIARLAASHDTQLRGVPYGTALDHDERHACQNSEAHRSRSSPQIRPGQSTLAFFTAENTSNKVITGVSTYNVTPQQAGTYFNKIQCYCFEVGPFA